MKLLLLEQDPIIASDLRYSLEAANFDVFWTVSLEEAARWLRANQPDAAVIDAKACGETSAPIAHILADRDVPFLVYSTQMKGQNIDPVLDNAVWVSKPIETARLIATIKSLAR